MNSLFRKKSVTQILQDIEDNKLQEGHGLNKTLRLTDLVSFGIAAIIGAGIFSTIGKASYDGGPAVMFLFIFTAIACLFSALCYAEFASTIPISGSAYTYAYTTFGEVIAWVLGWALVMEYAVGNIAVAISWSDYFTTLMQGLGLDIPAYFTMDYLSASRAFAKSQVLLSEGISLDKMPDNIKIALQAWNTAPQISGVRLIADLPALLITLSITALVYVGIKESKNAGNAMVLLKVIVVIMVIIVGAFYVNPANWSPFAPNGVTGVLKGVSAVFFAYIGFDAISTTAEECKNPQRDLPRAMMYSLVVCTILYTLLALVLTGMVSYTELEVGDPLAYVFGKLHIDFMAGIISLSAGVAMASVFLVFQLGQPRILMTMSRDGLLPKAFARVHPKYKTPSFSTIFTGFLVAIPALFMNLTEVTDLTSIGTLFAFAVVSAGVLRLENVPEQKGVARFRVPYYNSQWIIPIGLVVLHVLLWQYNRPEVIDFYTFTNKNAVELREKSLKESIETLPTLTEAKRAKKQIAIADEKVSIEQAKKLSTWDVTLPRLPMWGFWIGCIVMAFLCFKHKLSLIPVMGVLTNFYLMTQLGIQNWMWFGVWMAIGLTIYFSYGYRFSKLRKS
ncbi:MAG: amino acid permease [Bacteroidetes bacterium]|nr:MAG: amino acid permease [Bacteroidota bacterium]